MVRRRRPRNFDDNEFEETSKGRSNFKFPYGETEEVQSDNEQQERQGLTLRREERTKPKRSYTPDKSSSFTIQKAREIPSSIYGTKKHKKNLENIDLSKLEDEPKTTGYRSSIIEDIKKERIRKLRRQQEIREKKRLEQLRMLQFNQPSYVREKSDIKKENTDYEQLSLIEDMKENIPKSDEKPKETAVEEREIPKKLPGQMTLSEKRRGPKFTLPSLHNLGRSQSAKYKEEDPELTLIITQAFDAIGLPVTIQNYHSNGMFAVYELKLGANFRIGQIQKLKELLKPHLKDLHLRISSTNLGHGLISIEVPMLKKYPITYSTLFTSSSLKLRKNDFKLVIGKTLDDYVCSFQLLKAGHILLFGGENSSAERIITQTIISLFMNQNPNELKVHFVTEGNRYRVFQNTPYAFDVAQNVNNEHAFDSISKELLERQNQFRRAHVRNISSFNQRVSMQNKKSIILVVIDDFESILKDKNSMAYHAIVQLLSKGKPLGIHVLVRQSNIETDLRFEFLRLLQTRISFYDKKSKVMVGADEISEDANDCLVQLPTTTRPIRVTLGQISDNSIREVIQHIKEAYMNI